jgi:alpha-L-glutamate ligase-like protein
MPLSYNYKLSFFDRLGGVLGINARNLLYISRFNTKTNKSFADDKMFTKNYLQSRGLGAAKVYTVIKNYNDLKQFNPKSLPENFVIKPNHGYGGEGIMVFSEKKGNNFVDITGQEYDWQRISRHISSILDGEYAISGLTDQAIIEERLIAHNFFKPFAKRGLPDIRVIVFNYVPVIAMLRLPTDESAGKANLHQGAIGLGVDIATGTATYGVCNNKFIRTLPNGEKLSDIKIPRWDEILLAATNAQKVSQIGFLAVDLVLTTSGIKILELNARAGLSIQIANQIPLRARLKKVADLKVPTPEKGVELCKALFSSNAPSDGKETKTGRTAIGLFEHIELLNTDYDHVLAKIDPHYDGVLLDNTMAAIETDDSFIDIKLKGKRLTIPATFGDLSAQNYKAIIGGKFLDHFTIHSATNKHLPYESPTTDISREEKIINNIDKKLFEIDKKITIAGFLRPINHDEEKRIFFENPTHSPQFVYRAPTLPIPQMRKDLKALPEATHPLYTLYKKKITEIETKLDLLESIDSPKLQTASEKLYGPASRVLYDQAVRYIHEHPVQPDQSGKVSFKQVLKRLTLFLEEHKLSNWHIKAAPDRVNDISVSLDGTIHLREGVTFTENRLRAVIAHEIETHIYRAENSRLQKYKIFEIGTAGYIATEEGLAVYNQRALGVPLGEKEIWAPLRSIGAYLAQEMSFVDLFHYLKSNYGLGDDSAWHTCVKVKRGLADTNKKIAFTRDTIYFKGLQMVEEFLAENTAEKMKYLYIGKIGIDDLNQIGALSQYKSRYVITSM